MESEKFLRSIMIDLSIYWVHIEYVYTLTVVCVQLEHRLSRYRE